MTLTRRVVAAFGFAVAVVLVPHSVAWAEVSDTATATTTATCGTAVDPCMTQLVEQQYVVLSLFGATVVFLGMAWLVKSEAVPVLRG